MKLIEELKRRNVLRVGVAYLVASWLLLQVIDVIGPILRLPEQVARYALFLAAAGLLPVLVSAWLFELTPEGIRKESGVNRSRPTTARTGRRLDRAIIVILALAVGLLAWDRLFVQQPVQPQTPPAPTGQEGAASTAQLSAPPGLPEAAEPRSVAVLPFAVMSNGPDDDYFADGLTEEIINALAQLPELLVTARTSAFQFRDRNVPVSEIARQLGVEHVVEGSVRRAGERLRITAQLVRADDGFHLWSQTYDRQTADTFAVQTDIAEKVAQALNVLLDDTLRERMQRVGTRDVDAFIAFQKGIEYYERAHSEPGQISLLRQANAQFEAAVGREPGLFPAYDYHTDLYSHILISHAAGQLDGDITDADVAAAPVALRADLERGIRAARSAQERANAEFGRALLLGPWRGLALLIANAAAPPGCESAVWLHLAGPFRSQAPAVLNAFYRMAACDPLRVRPMVHVVGTLLWLGRPGEAVRAARAGLQRVEHPFLSRHLALALAFSGDPDAARRAASDYIRAEDELLSVRANLAAIAGDAEMAAEMESEYLGKYGPDDREALIFEALRGQRGEANRLAAGIDARPFGHVVLLQAIYACFCGAPFDIEATPVFAAMIADSGLDWPPAHPYGLPLKDW